MPDPDEPKGKTRTAPGGRLDIDEDERESLTDEPEDKADRDAKPREVRREG